MDTENRPSHDERRPPLPPRPSTAARSTVDGKPLQAQATTAVTPVDIQTLSFPDGSRGTFSAPASGSAPISISSPRGGSGNVSPSRRGVAAGGENGDDGASVVSFSPTMRPLGDIASLLAGELNKTSPAWNMLRSQAAAKAPFEKYRNGQPQGRLAEFGNELRELPQKTNDNFKDDDRLAVWKAKLKHYMILSSAGKPIWSRHGDLNLINSSIGVVQTIISFYEGSKNALQGFTAGNTRFVVLTQGPLYFVAISKLGESDSQLRAQLEALYMQILSTLTLPRLLQIFVNRPSSDLRTPLQGTETLLSSLADSFTLGSPSVLLGSLECLKLRKSQRGTITSTFLKLRTDKLLYGLIVAGGKLVSVIRPRRHSLHPSDLQLIFNMLFESGGIKSGGGESWIPLCLPAFNSSGYLYMYVSFFEGAEIQKPNESSPVSPSSSKVSEEEQLAMILISTDRESFFDLKQMRDKVVSQLAKNGSMNIIQSAVTAGRPKCDEVFAGSAISHFLFKSRANVQFCMASLEPLFTRPVDRRRLVSLYHELHTSAHAKYSNLKVLHCIMDDASSLGWITPAFEFFCVAGPNVPRAAMMQGANKIIQWIKKEEERLFIVGGGVF